MIVQRLPRFLPLAAIVLSLLLLSACSEYNKMEIRELLDARDAAVSQHDLTAYETLLITDYHAPQQTRQSIITKMRHLFAQFKQIEMKSNNRFIRMNDSTHAECEQSYILRVFADGDWRQLSERERLQLTKTPNGWKISGGL